MTSEEQSCRVRTRRQFIRDSAATVVTAACSVSLNLRAADETLKVRNANVPGTRLARLATGANVSHWFRFPRTESADHFANYITEAEASLMQHMGLKHVRLCVAPKIIMNQTTGAVREDAAKYVEAAIQRFHRAGLLVVVDLHNEDRAAEASAAWEEAFARFWEALAARLCKFDPEWSMFEIVNEPVFHNHEADWDVLNARFAAAIRKNAPAHTIITSGANWGGIGGLQRLKPLADKNVVYSFHCYDPFPFTHQGATWASQEVRPLRGIPYPSSPEAVAPLLAGLADQPRSQKMVEEYGKERWNKDKLAARFKQGVDWGAQNGVPLYCGEFGVFPRYAKPEHRANWFRDFGQVLAEHQIGWAVWSWDEGFGLNRRFVDGKPVVESVVRNALGLRE
jgi:aryl-phospho-beta-D-glucosidase BglC (GH1 family)